MSNYIITKYWSVRWNKCVICVERIRTSKLRIGNQFYHTYICKGVLNTVTLDNAFLQYRSRLVEVREDQNAAFEFQDDVRHPQAEWLSILCSLGNIYWQLTSFVFKRTTPCAYIMWKYYKVNRFIEALECRGKRIVRFSSRMNQLVDTEMQNPFHACTLFNILGLISSRAFSFSDIVRKYLSTGVYESWVNNSTL